MTIIGMIIGIIPIDTIYNKNTNTNKIEFFKFLKGIGAVVRRVSGSKTLQFDKNLQLSVFWL